MKSLSELSNDSIETQFRLASVWKARGKLETAISGFEKVLRVDPEYAPAYVKLGEIMLELGDPEDSMQYYKKALQFKPGDADVRFRYNYLKDILNKCSNSKDDTLVTETDRVLAENPSGKINLNHQKRFQCHRSGWNYALRALQPVHNSQGIGFDGFIENNFAWKHRRQGMRPPNVLKRLKNTGTYRQFASSEERGITPYLSPWIGCIHNPTQMPQWFHYHESPQTIFNKEIWKRSVEHCRGLFTFSECHANWIHQQTGINVTTLVFPTEIPETQFHMQRFMTNANRKIVQIGWWLRRLSAIYQLPLASDNPMNYRKLRLVPMFFDNADSYLRGLIDEEIKTLGLSMPPKYIDNTLEQMHISNYSYDELLSENIAFLYLYDANANNAVVECIARATPLLVNPLPAVVEYLGESYPFYYSDLSEAAEKTLDISLIQKTHEYLKTCPVREKLSADYFLQSFINSGIYQAL